MAMVIAQIVRRKAKLLTAEFAKKIRGERGEGRGKASCGEG
jgi:hypothetical protein